MNNSIEQIMDAINDKVGDYISDGMYQDLKSDITFALAEKDREIERRVREINACYGFQKNQTAEIKKWRDMCNKLAGVIEKCSAALCAVRPCSDRSEVGYDRKIAEAGFETGRVLREYNAMKRGQPASEPIKEAGK